MKSFEEINKSVVLVMTVYVGGGGAGGEVTTVQGTVVSLDSGVTDQLSPSPHLRPQ